MRNPNRRFKAYYEDTYFDKNNGGDNSKKKHEKPFWIQCLLCVPKNLVYVFIGVICAAFAGMSYITYTKQNLKDFIRFSSKE